MIVNGYKTLQALDKEEQNQLFQSFLTTGKIVEGVVRTYPGGKHIFWCVATSPSWKLQNVYREYSTFTVENFQNKIPYDLYLYMLANHEDEYPYNTNESLTWNIKKYSDSAANIVDQLPHEGATALLHAWLVTKHPDIYPMSLDKFMEDFAKGETSAYKWWLTNRSVQENIHLLCGPSVYKTFQHVVGFIHGDPRSGKSEKCI